MRRDSAVPRRLGDQRVIRLNDTRLAVVDYIFAAETGAAGAFGGHEWATVMAGNGASRLSEGDSATFHRAAKEKPLDCRHQARVARHYVIVA